MESSVRPRDRRKKSGFGHHIQLKLEEYLPAADKKDLTSERPLVETELGVQSRRT